MISSSRVSRAHDSALRTIDISNVKSVRVLSADAGLDCARKETMTRLRRNVVINITKGEEKKLSRQNKTKNTATNRQMRGDILHAAIRYAYFFSTKARCDNHCTKNPEGCHGRSNPPPLPLPSHHRQSLFKQFSNEFHFNIKSVEAILSLITR